MLTVSADALINRLSSKRLLKGKNCTDIEIQDSIRKISKELKVAIPCPSASALDRSISLLENGRLNAAKKSLEDAIGTQRQIDPRLSSDIKLASAAIDLSQGDTDSATQKFLKVKQLNAQQNDAFGVAAVEHNTGVAEIQAGNPTEANRYFSRTQLLNRLTINRVQNSSMSQQELILRTSDGQFHGIEISSQLESDRQLPLRLQHKTVEFSLNQTVGRLSQKLQDQFLKERIEARTLKEVYLDFADPIIFVTYLAHIGGFILPLAIGDCYFELGKFSESRKYYVKCRDYPYLNQAIELPMIWMRTARTYIGEGVSRRQNDKLKAKKAFEYVVKNESSEYILSGPLYEEAFAKLKSACLDFLNSGSRELLDAPRREVFLTALLYLNEINAGTALSTPIYNWRYLQDIARYFAAQAVKAESSYINFQKSSEQEAATKQILDQSVAVNKKLVDMELEAENLAEDQYQLASSQLSEIEKRIDLIGLQIRDHEILQPTYWDIAYKEAKKMFSKDKKAIAFAKAKMSVTYEIELDNLKRQKQALEESREVAEKRLAVAVRMKAMAKIKKEIAEAKHKNSINQLADFQKEVFHPEFWTELARRHKELSATYLERAADIALTMQKAFNFEYDLNKEWIQSEYVANSMSDLLAADYLLSDIDKFSVEHILCLEKQVPVKSIISLAESYPLAFDVGFKENGKINFETKLEEFDRNHPGLCLRKIKRIEVKFEGLISSSEINGFLKNRGFSYYRSRSGQQDLRLQPPEVMPLSAYDVRNDSFIFTSDESVLQLFENSGVASSWILELTQNSDIDFQTISDIKLIFHFDAIYSKSAEYRAKADLAISGQNEAQIIFDLKSIFIDEFFSFQDTGKVTFALDTTYLPYYQSNPHIKKASLIIESEQNYLPLTVEIGIGDSSFAYLTNEDGIIGQFDELKNHALIDTWTISIPKDQNQNAFDSGFTWEKVSNIILFTEYVYTPRSCVAAKDDFSIKPMAKFDVVDDPAAVYGGVSQWGFDFRKQCITQTSNIHAPNGTKNLNSSPNKPGTYLIHKTSAEWPNLSDLALCCHLNSGDDDGIGLILRYQDVNNFYFFLMDTHRRYRRIGKKRNGQFYDLETEALDKGVVYKRNQNYKIVFAAVGNVLKVSLDGDEILSGVDNEILTSGRVGFYSWGNSRARFLDLSMRSI